MLKLFSKEATTFTTLGLGVLRDYYSDPIITEELNGSYTLELEYAKDGYLADQLVEQNIIVAKGQAFRIVNVDKTINDSSNTIKILAKHIFFDLAFNFLEDVAPTNLTAQSALAWILARTQTSNNFSVNGDCTATSSARYVRKNVTDAIYSEDNALLKRFGGELSFNNWNVFVHAKRGQDANFSIRYRKNLSGIEFKLDFSTVATRIMPQGANELLIDNKYVDSPNISNYFTPIYKKVEFSDIGVDEETTESEAKQKLIDAVNNLYAQGIDKPEISIKVDFIELSKCTEYKDYANLESCNLGDTIKVIIPELNLNLTTRVVKTIYNEALGRYTNLELGSITPNFVSSQSKAISEMGNIVAKVNPDSILSQAQDNAKNLINHPFNGNILIDNETGVLYLMDTTDPSTAQSVWKWSLGGLGYSSTGINGTYQVAITQDGSINANFITSGTIATSRIQGYDALITEVSQIVGGYSLTTDTTYQAGTTYYSKVNDDYIELIAGTDYDIGDPITGDVYIYEDTLQSQLENIYDTLNGTDDTEGVLTTLENVKNEIQEVHSTMLTQTSEEFIMSFVQGYINNAFNEVNELAQSNNETLTGQERYIRFVGGNIELGEKDNEVKLLIQKDRISFMTGGNESAYISNNQLYITDSTILNKLQIGHWEAKENDNSNLNIKWIGGVI